MRVVIAEDQALLGAPDAVGGCSVRQRRGASATFVAPPSTAAPGGPRPRRPLIAATKVPLAGSPRHPRVGAQDNRTWDRAQWRGEGT
jgi:hypothetical protein